MVRKDTGVPEMNILFELCDYEYFRVLIDLANTGEKKEGR
jgi:hypothetical protein